MDHMYEKNGKQEESKGIFVEFGYKEFMDAIQTGDEVSFNLKYNGKWSPKGTHLFGLGTKTELKKPETPASGPLALDVKPSSGGLDTFLKEIAGPVFVELFNNTLTDVQRNLLRGNKSIWEKIVELNNELGRVRYHG